MPQTLGKGEIFVPKLKGTLFHRKLKKVRHCIFNITVQGQYYGIT
jgi:hypothetical protein